MCPSCGHTYPPDRDLCPEDGTLLVAAEALLADDTPPPSGVAGSTALEAANDLQPTSRLTCQIEMTD